METAPVRQRSSLARLEEQPKLNSKVELHVPRVPAGFLQHSPITNFCQRALIPVTEKITIARCEIKMAKIREGSCGFLITLLTEKWYLSKTVLAASQGRIDDRRCTLLLECRGVGMQHNVVNGESLPSEIVFADITNI